MITNTQTSIISLVVSVISLLVTSYCLYAVFKLNNLKTMFFSGPKGQEMEPVLMSIMQNVEHLEKKQESAQVYMSQMREQLGFAVQRVGIIRYNPFAESGGNFSFSIALLNEHSTGLVLSSLYGRQQNRVYAKNITEGKSEIPLTEEEEQALKQATHS